MSDSAIRSARALIQAGRLQEARQLLMGVIRDEPRPVGGLNELATVELLEGKYLSGLELVQEVLLIDPEDRSALDKRDLVQARLRDPVHDRPLTDPEFRSALLRGYDGPPPPSPGPGRAAVGPGSCANPRISIIIPVFNQVEYTKQCIEAVWTTCQDQAYEVIVVDDCSTDGTHEYLQSVKQHVRSFRNEENQGFILNCNAAAAQARGEYLVLLNNDTIPQERWLEGLLEPFQLYERVAATGALMIHPDNKILEACSIVFSDGSGWNYGRGDSPHSSRYNFIREVDYVSGGGMMVPKQVWEELGGLDAHYRPAYYDDIDFCFRARRAGYKVLYTPYARIIHFEGMSGGTDVTKGVKRYQVVNHGKFRERWKDELKAQPENRFENVFRASRRGAGKRILWIDHVLPLPNLNSGCLRMNHLMKSMVQLGHQITYVTLSNVDPEGYKDVMRKMGVETLSLGYEKWHHSAREAETVDRVLDALEVRGRNYDVVYLSFYWVAMLFIRKIRRRLPSAVIYVDSHDIHFLRTRREAQLRRDRMHKSIAEQTKVDELGVYARADGVLTVTELDRQALLKELPGATVFLMPNAHDVVPVGRGFEERRDLLFIGGFKHTPNVDAMLYFCAEIFPKVLERLPGLRLLIVGSHPSEEVKALASDSIEVTGWVSETKPYLDQCRISIAPLRYGAGMKGKVGEAMCHGLPVITTSVGSEGMGIVDGEHAIVVDGVDEWVEQIVRLYADGELWGRLSANGQALMSSRYGSGEMLKRAERLLEFGSREEVANQSSYPLRRTKAYEDVVVSIIVVARDRVEHTRECIASVKEFARVPHRIIVVDNGSTDKTAAYLGALGGVDVLLNEENVGFPAAINQALNRADGDYVLVLHDDVVVTEGWLEGLVGAAEADPAIGLVGPTTNRAAGAQVDEGARYKSMKEMHKHARAVRKENRGRTTAVPRVGSFCALVRREVIDRIGGLDERFGPGILEDDDFCLRARLAGFQAVVARDVFVHHHGSKGLGADGRRSYAERSEANGRVFAEKWGAGPDEIWEGRREPRKRNPRYPLSKDLFIQQFERARILIEDRELALALESLKKALAYFRFSERRWDRAEYLEVLNVTGNVAMLLHDHDTAAECYEKELTVSPDPERARAGLENVRRARERRSGAPGNQGAPVPTGAGRDAPDAEAQQVLSRAEELGQGGRVDDAVGVLQAAVTALPGNGALCGALAWRLIRNKRFAEASALIHSLPDSSKSDVGEWLEIAGYCTEGQGLDDVAAQCADRALQVSPGSSRAWTLKGMLAAKSGDEAEAERRFALAIERGAGDAAPQFHLGALLWRQGRRAEGFARLEKAFDLDATDAEIAVTFYGAAASLDRLDAIEPRLSQASSRYPANRQLKHLVADALVRLGRREEAMNAVEEAIARFGADDDIVPFALEIRDALGPRELRPPDDGRRTISLCMVVKDEERHLARCLASVKALVDEMIVVDTGSTDRSTAIATLFGAKVHRVDGTGELSGARNLSLAQAAGDWILVLDGHEALSPDDHGRVRDLVASGGGKAFSFATGSPVVPAGPRVRLFPRADSIRFHGAVQDPVEASPAESTVDIEECGIAIHRMGED